MMRPCDKAEGCRTAQQWQKTKETDTDREGESAEHLELAHHGRQRFQLVVMQPKLLKRRQLSHTHTTQTLMSRTSIDTRSQSDNSA